LATPQERSIAEEDSAIPSLVGFVRRFETDQAIRTAAAGCGREVFG